MIPNKLLLLFFFTIVSNAQIGIGTPSPDASALLDLTSTTKGLLLPRMTTVQQAAIINPAIGLTIFNTTTGQIETNKGDSLGGILWSSNSSTDSTSVGGGMTISSSTDTSTVLDIDSEVSLMELHPSPGMYSVMFNGQYNINPGNVASFITTPKGVVDLSAAYSQLNFMTPTNTTHPLSFGLGETITPGVYATVASTIAGTLILDGQNNPNSLFIFKINGSLGVGDATIIYMINGAAARNIFWVAEGGISIGASSVVKGTFLSHDGAVAMGASCILEGRLLSTLGAVNTIASTINVPLNTSSINLGILSVFALFTSSGAVGNTGISFVSGHVGSNEGAITGYTATTDSMIFIPSTAPYPIDNSIFATFSVYLDNVLIPNSVRTIISKLYKTDVVTVLTTATVLDGNKLEVRWNTNLGTLSMTNRVLTVLKM